ncbi:hypothetical protein JTE90_020724 [Oedothorax gibbosus]|uniref:RWD domain-containing protein n=1 Tax=Oedothorax gibbosus TaxID=931172 RepID=A0AAV6V423_9ARAC|nr:hypothetical protein JTE90_020724 [Oedothorax gibbosus]
MESSTENKTLQEEEIEALSSIYGEEWVLEDYNERVYSINITSSSKKCLYFQVILPNSYPLKSPPVYRISCPWMSRQAKNRLSLILDEIYSENIGESIIYQWIIHVQDFINEQDVNGASSTFEDCSAELAENLLAVDLLDKVDKLAYSDASNGGWSDEIPLIQHGETIMDRKSVFQAHVAKVVSVKQVKQVLQNLKENKKIAIATHNIYAYRISRENQSFIQDCEDDGETKAGSVLLHLLQVLDVSNVLVMVSRWYGGIHLGADRFKHINNAARSVLLDSGFITKKETPKKSKKTAC